MVNPSTSSVNAEVVLHFAGQERDDQPRMWIHLLELHLVGCDWSAGSVEDEEACACGSLVNGSDEPLLELLFVILGDIAILALRRRPRSFGLLHLEWG